jgi:hypothetical protein
VFPEDGLADLSHEWWFSATGRYGRFDKYLFRTRLAREVTFERFRFQLQEARNALGHGLGSAAVLLAWGALEAALRRSAPAVGNGNAVGVGTEIAQCVFWPAERTLGVDDPVVAEQYPQPRGEGAVPQAVRDVRC